MDKPPELVRGFTFFASERTWCLYDFVNGKWLMFSTGPDADAIWRHVLPAYIYRMLEKYSQ